eukprot:15360898-Ditylum_brightwellii.AAC.1
MLFALNLFLDLFDVCAQRGQIGHSAVKFPFVVNQLPATCTYSVADCLGGSEISITGVTMSSTSLHPDPLPKKRDIQQSIR